RAVGKFHRRGAGVDRGVVWRGAVFFPARAGLRPGPGGGGPRVLFCAVGRGQKERDEAERKFLNRAMQQTSVAAVGQCALTNRDLSVIYEQAVYRVAEMFAVEYAMLFQRLPDGS